MIPYLDGGEDITPDEMNALFGALDDKLDMMLGGKSFALIYKNSGLATKQ